MNSYTRALHLYNQLTTPPRSKVWKAMEDNAKPLRGVGCKYKSLHKTDSGVIYYKLHDTRVCTIYPPNADGEFLTEYRYYNAQSTDMFIYEFGLGYDRLHTTEGTWVSVPRVAQFCRNGGGAKVTASLVFDANDKLIVAKSSHADIYTRVSNAEDKAKRRALTKELDILIMLCGLKLEQYRADAEIRHDYGAAFAKRRNQPVEISDFLRLMDDLRFRQKRDGTPIDLQDSTFVNCVLELGQGVFNVLASKRACSEEEGRHYYSPTPKVCAEAINSVTSEDFNRSLYNRLMDGFGIKTGSDFKPWGQFMPTLPRKAVHL